MPKLQPILMPLTMQPKDLDFLPRFDLYPCEAIYQASCGSQDVAVPHQNFSLRAYPQDNPMLKLEFDSAYQFRDAGDLADPRSHGLTAQDITDMMEGWIALNSPRMSTHEFFQQLFLNSLTQKRGRQDLPELPKDNHVVVGDGYAFSLMMGADDPSSRFVPWDFLRRAEPELCEDLDLTSNGADYFIGITVWGARLQSAHGKLSMLNLFSRILPRAAGVDEPEILPALWQPQKGSSIGRVRAMAAGRPPAASRSTTP
jgi:hypothetical protein